MDMDGRAPMGAPIWARALVTTLCILVAVGGWSVSYATQAALAAQHHFAGWEAWAWPGIADTAALAVMLRLHLGQVRAGWPTAEAWTTFGLAAGIMVVANTAAHPDDPLSIGMHAILPVVPMLVWHLVIHGRPIMVAQAPAEERAEPPHSVGLHPLRPIPSPRTNKVAPSAPRPRIVGKPNGRESKGDRAAAVAYVADEVAAGRVPDVKGLRTASGAPRTTAQRWLGELHTPAQFQAATP